MRPRPNYTRPVIALYRLLRNLFFLPFWPLWLGLRYLTRPKGTAVMLKLEKRIVPILPAKRWFRDLIRSFNGQTDPTSLTDVTRLADLIAGDALIKSVLVRIAPLEIGWATACGLRRELEKLTTAGKRVVAYLPEGGGNGELFIATAASEIVISPQATFGPLGLAASIRYLKPLLDKVGIGVEVEARREFKTAAEPALRSEMSDAQRLQTTALMTAMDSALRAAITQRGANPAEVIDHAIIRGQDAISLKLVDRLCYDDELAQLLTGKSDGSMIDAYDYVDHRESRYFQALRRAPYVAVIRVDGAIVSTAPKFRSPGKSVADQKSIIGALRRVARDRRALGVVLYVNSPGGSALASDLIHREVALVNKKKPVVACFGQVAASGGYYIAAPARSIVAESLTITGSIGVIMAKVVAVELTKRLGVNTDTIRLSPHADMFSTDRNLTEKEREILAREADSFYRAFVDIVAEGRGRSFEEIEPLARGRVWAGGDASERGLVDELGGLDTALRKVKDELKDLPEKKKKRLKLRPIGPPRSSTPPPLSDAAAEAAGLVSQAHPGAAIAMRLAPELFTLMELADSRDRALYYAHDLPTVEC
ncbi:MAG: protease-4 [Myxococcota bacterium]|jgi:protease-4